MYSARHTILVLSLVAIVSTIGTAQITRNRIKDDAYGPSWNGDRYYGASRNALYDQMVLFAPGDPNIVGFAAVDPNDGDAYYHDTGGTFSSFLTSAWWRSLASDANDAEWAQDVNDVVYNVRRYGATGDGATDDLSAFNLAAGKLTDGDTLYCPPGDYKLSGSVTIEPNRVTVMGPGALYAVGSAPAVILDGNDCTVTGLEVYGDGPTDSNSYSGVRCLGSGSRVTQSRFHDLYASGVEIRDVNCLVDACIVWDCRKDGVTFKDEGTDNSIVRNCYIRNTGRSAVGTDSDTENVIIKGVVAHNTGVTGYIAEHHNVFHFEDCNRATVTDSLIIYDGDSDFCSNNDAELKFAVAINSCPDVLVDGLTILVETTFDFSTLTTWRVLGDYGDDAGRPHKIRNLRVLNRTDELYTLLVLQSTDFEFSDCEFYGPVGDISQGYKAAGIKTFRNCIVDGNNLEFDFYDSSFGGEPNNVFQGNTFRNIDGWAFRGRYQNCTWLGNTFQDCNGIYLEYEQGDASDESHYNRIFGNSFIDCNDVLATGASVTTAGDYNAFAGNFISGNIEYLFKGDSGSTSVDWRNNILAVDADVTNLTTNAAFTIGLTGRSSYDDEQYRSGAGTPVSSVTPIYIGEEYYDTSGGTWYKATGLTNTDWVALN